MKNLFKSMMLVAAAAMGFTACSKDATEEVAPETKGATKTITVVTDITRTQFGDSRDKLVWSEGDEFGVFTDVATDKNISSGTYVPEGSYTLEVAENATMIYAYYPRNTYSDSRTAQTVSITIPQNQTQTAPAVFNGSYMPMTAKGAIEGTSVSLKFAPVACALALNVYNGESGETIESIAFSSNEECCGYDSAGNDITADELNYKGYNKTATVTVGTEEAPVAIPADAASVDDKLTFDNQIYLVVACKAYSEGAKFVVTTSKNTYTFTTKKALDCSTYDFMPVNLDLAKGETPAPVVIPTGNVVILAENGSDYYAVSSNNQIKGTNNSDRRDNILFTYNKEEYVSTTDETLVWNIQKTEAGTYTIKSVATSEYINSGDNLAPMGTTAENFNITLNSEGYYEIVPASGSYTSRRFEQNNQKIGFGFYAKTQNAKILIVPASLKPSVSVTEKEFAIAADNTAEHTFTCTVSGEGAELTDVTLTQDTASKSWLEATYADGTVTYKASANETDAPRTATLTLAIADGNSVEITVTQAAPIKKLIVTLSVEGTTASWTANASPVVGYNYTVTADAAGTGEVVKSGENVQETSLDLSTLGLETGTYYLHVQALGDGIATSDSEIVTSEGIAVEKGDAPEYPSYNETFTKWTNANTSNSTSGTEITDVCTWSYTGASTAYWSNISSGSSMTNAITLLKPAKADGTFILSETLQNGIKNIKLTARSNNTGTGVNIYVIDITNQQTYLIGTIKTTTKKKDFTGEFDITDKNITGDYQIKIANINTTAYVCIGNLEWNY